MDLKKYFVLIAFALLPFAFLSGGIVHGGQQFAIVILSLIALAATVRNNYIFAFMTYFGIWLVFILVYRLFHSSLPATVVAAAFNQYTFFLAGLAIFVAITRSTIKKEVFYNVICVVALIQAVIALFQFLGLQPVGRFLNLFLPAKGTLDIHMMTGTLGNNNFLGAFVAISLPFFFRAEKIQFRGRVLNFRWFLFIPILAFVIYGSRTTSALVPALIGTTYYYWHQMSRRIKILLGVAIVLASVYYACFNHHPIWLNTRFIDWKIALEIWGMTTFGSIFGMGPGAEWGRQYPMHNEWLQCLYQFGLVGFVLLIGYVITIYKGNRVLFTAFIIIVINMFGNHSIHLAPSAFLIIIIAGLIERERNGRLQGVF